MNYATIKNFDIANGPGVRVSLFVSGCRRRCKGCFNSEAWDFGYGQKFTIETLVDLVEVLRDDNITGLSILGGDPLEPENISAVCAVCDYVKRFLPRKTIWLWTGYLWEDVKDLRVMNYIDILVDGPFYEDWKDLSLAFRGSSNQRIIDVQKSLNSDEIVYWKGAGWLK